MTEAPAMERALTSSESVRSLADTLRIGLEPLGCAMVGCFGSVDIGEREDRGERAGRDACGTAANGETNKRPLSLGNVKGMTSSGHSYDLNDPLPTSPLALSHRRGRSKRGR